MKLSLKERYDKENSELLKEFEGREPLVSIDCITYNHVGFIKDALEGFLMQETDFPVEVLIHDDASTDGTDTIIREYVEKYPDLIKPIYQKENQYSKGIPIWKNFQHPRAKGKYVAICEGDDYWTDPNKLQMQCDFLESHPDYSLCFHNATKHYVDGSKQDKPFGNIENREYSRYEFLSTWLAPTASYTFRVGVFETELYDKISKKRMIAGDTPLVIALSYMGKLQGFANTMSVYRVHSGGVTQKFNQYKLVKFQMQMREIFPEDVRATLNDEIGKIGAECTTVMRHGNISLGLKIMFLALFNAPKQTISYLVKWRFKKLTSFFKNKD